VTISLRSYELGVTNLLTPRALAVLALFAVMERPAHAYVDPGSGSMLLQLLLGGIAGVAVAVRMYWQRLRAFFGSRSDTTPKS
jgi:hypothetical protein